MFIRYLSEWTDIVVGSVSHVLPTHFTLPFHNQNSPVLDG